MLSPSQQARLRHQHETITEMIKGISEESLRTRPSTGKWSVFENVAHLAAYQSSFLERLRKIEKEDSPLFERYAAENDPHFFECVKMTLPEVTENLSAGRFIIINHILHLPENILRRTGQHPLYGKLSMQQWTEFFLLHEAHHLFTIFKLLNAHDK